MFKSCLKSALATLGALFLITLSACSSEEPAVSSTPPTSVKSDIRSVEDACNIALAFLEAGNDISASRSEGVIANVKIGYGATSRSGAADTLFYSVNLANDGGFVLVSAPTAAEPVLAYVENGSYDPAQTTDNPGFNMFIEKSKEYTSLAAAIGPGEGVPVKLPYYKIIKNVAPQLKVEWGQQYPEGIFCSNGYSGCVQTAMVQILSYLEQPTSIQLTYPECDRTFINLNWEEIKKHKVSYSDPSLYNTHLLTCDASEENHRALSYLCRELGYRNRANYWPDSAGTGTSIEPAHSLFKTLLPTKNISENSEFDSNNFDILMSKMTSNHAVAFFSGLNEVNVRDGHAWVCEGGRHYEYHTEIYFANGEEDVRDVYYFYFNWGNNGKKNGYCLGNVYDPNKTLKESELPRPTLPLSRANYSDFVHYFTIY